MKKAINIIIVESSPLVSEGFAGLLKKSGLLCRLFHAGSLDEAELLFDKNGSHLIVVNPIFINGSLKVFQGIKNRMEGVKWVGLVYAWHDPKILSAFDAVITVSDNENSIATIINKLQSDGEPEQGTPQEILTDREIDVLKLLATGLANKEIADKLNISVNTVITHRKNISQKTGIKSVSGLTIYAVTQKLISIDTVME